MWRFRRMERRYSRLSTSISVRKIRTHLLSKISVPGSAVGLRPARTQSSSEKRVSWIPNYALFLFQPYPVENCFRRNSHPLHVSRCYYRTTEKEGCYLSLGWDRSDHT